MLLSIIIPAYNEEKRLLQTLNAVAELDLDFECIIVNDGSTDKTTDIINSFNNDKFKLVSYAPNRGKGYAVAEGIRHSSGELVLFMDADNSTSVDHVEAFIEKIKEGNDLVIGSRRLRDSKIEVRQPWTRELLGYAFRTLIGFIMPLGVLDSQAGFKLMRRDFATKYAMNQKIYRWAFDVELLAMARSYKLKIAELPITWRNDSQSKVRLSGMINMLLEVFKIRYYYGSVLNKIKQKIT